MRLQLSELMQMQATLDQRIFDQHHITREDTHQRRILAALVEIGECANETRCFKFWSVKPASEREVILEEYVDVLHFMLSLAIDYQYQMEAISSVKVQSDLSLAFLELYRRVADLIVNDALVHFETCFQFFLGLGDELGFDEPMIKHAYDKKNEENFKRQRTNY